MRGEERMMMVVVSVEEDVLKNAVCASWQRGERGCGQIRRTAGLHLVVPTDSHHQKNIAR